MLIGLATVGEPHMLIGLATVGEPHMLIGLATGGQSGQALVTEFSLFHGVRVLPGLCAPLDGKTLVQTDRE